MSSSSSPISSAKFSYHIAASFIAKGRPYDPSAHIFPFNPYNRIQHTKQPKRSRPESGHDAFFVSRVGDSGAVAFGVTDGVGGWMDRGVDPADFSHAFCDYMATSAYEHAQPSTPRNLADGAIEEPEPLTARRLMQKGYEAVCADRTIFAGGSTACVGVASPDGVLDVANLGDSGFLILRLNGVHAYSEPQTHAFNTPFQLSVVPPLVAARMALFGGSQLNDSPRDADVTHHDLRHGDIIVLASDGVWDNLFNQDILRIVSKTMTSAGAWVHSDAGGIRVPERLGSFTEPAPSGDAETRAAHTLQSVLATQITANAKAASVNRRVDGPFAKAVQKAFPRETYHGGKVDDIVVLVAVVAEGPSVVRSKL